jgi:hypothetical protein
VALSTDLAALRDAKPRTFDQWLETAEEDDKTIVLEAINDVTLPANALAVTLAKNGIPVTRPTIVKIRESAN